MQVVEHGSIQIRKVKSDARTSVYLHEPFRPPISQKLFDLQTWNFLYVIDPQSLIQNFMNKPFNS